MLFCTQENIEPRKIQNNLSAGGKPEGNLGGQAWSWVMKHQHPLKTM